MFVFVIVNQSFMGFLLGTSSVAGFQAGGRWVEINIRVIYFFFSLLVTELKGECRDQANMLLNLVEREFSSWLRLVL